LLFLLILRANRLEEFSSNDSGSSDILLRKIWFDLNA